MSSGAVKLEKQLEVLAECGIEPSSQSAIRHIVDEWGREELENSPYDLLLSSLGDDYEDAQGNWVPASAGIWHVDTECIYDAQNYVEVAKRLALLTRGNLILNNIEAHFETDAWLQFETEGNRHHWSLEVDGDWIDTSVFDRFAALLENVPSDRRFLASETDTQDFLLVCPTKEEFDRLASLTPERFTAIRSTW